jgi:zinc protease
MRNKFNITCTLLAFFWTSPLHAADAPAIENFTLKNGLEVIVIPNHRIPAVNHTLWYRIGAADDPSGKSGLAHYHEHAMFLGTKKYKSGEYSNIIARSGGEQNAFTGHDATAYFINISKENLPLAMEMEADRMGGLTASDDAMEKEKQVIIEERRMRVDNNPDALLYEQVNALLFRHHPYRLPVIGWQHEMNILTKQDVIDFHKKWYHPNNAILIVGGDVTAAEVKPLAEKYYGKIPRATIPTRHWNEEPPQRAERRITMRHSQVSQPELSRVYATSSLGYGKKEQALPLFVLAQVLGGGKTSRLYRSLVTEQKLATAINVDYNGFTRGPAEFSIELVPEQGVDPEKLEEAAAKELEKFLQEGLTDEELARAKTLLKAETIFARDGLSEIANVIGWIRMIGLDSSYFTNFSELVDKISAEDVLAAAKETLRREQSVTALLLPEDVKKNNTLNLR